MDHEGMLAPGGETTATDATMSADGTIVEAAVAARAQGTRQRLLRWFEYRRMLADLMWEEPDAYCHAQVAFRLLTDPTATFDPDPWLGLRDEMREGFGEWLVFDFDGMGGGMTPLQRAATEDDTLRDLAATQFFSRFWVMEHDGAGALATLREEHTGDEYSVAGIPCLPDGGAARIRVVARIASVGGRWRCCGMTPCAMQDPTVPKVGPSGRHDQPHRQNPNAFVAYLRSQYGSGMVPRLRPDALLGCEGVLA